MIDLTEIVLGLLALIGTIITAVAVPYIRSRTSVQQQVQLDHWVAMAVSAAEQVYTGSRRGREKKEYVLSFLKDKGFTVDEDALDAMIESAVYKLKNGVIAMEV